MPCITEETKQKVISADLFQVEVEKATALGSFNSFFVLPVALIVYATLLATLQNPAIDETSLIVAKECTPFEFTCTSKYGCEIAALGKRTTATFSKGNMSLLLEQGESASEKICAGQSEALDIAPRASAKIEFDHPISSFALNGTGYFMTQSGTVVQVNLTTMRSKQTKIQYPNDLKAGFFRHGNLSWGSRT